MKLRALAKVVVVVAIGVIVLAATPAPRPTAVQLDCPVLSVRVWCSPDCKSVGCDRYCSKLWDWDEYHLWVDAKADALEGEGPKQKATKFSVEIEMLDSPHVGLTIPTDSVPQTTLITQPDVTINDVAIAWKDKNSSNGSSFVLWRDTLSFDVTTVSEMPSYQNTGTVTTLWHGTCVKTSQQLPTVTPVPKAVPKGAKSPP
jgi:hypothetical protein